MAVQPNEAPPGSSFIVSDGESELGSACTVNKRKRTSFVRNESSMVCEGISRSEKFSASIT